MKITGVQGFSRKLSSIRQMVDTITKKGGDANSLRDLSMHLDVLHKISQGLQEGPIETKLLKGAIASMRKENSQLRRAEKFVSQMDKIQHQMEHLQQENRKLHEELESLRQESKRFAGGDSATPQPKIQKGKSEEAKKKAEKNGKGSESGIIKAKEANLDKRTSDRDDWDSVLGNEGMLGSNTGGQDVLLIDQKIISSEPAANIQSINGAPAMIPTDRRSSRKCWGFPGQAICSVYPAKKRCGNETKLWALPQGKDKEAAARHAATMLSQADKTGVLSLPPDKTGAKGQPKETPVLPSKAASKGTAMLPMVEPIIKKDGGGDGELGDTEVLKILQLEPEQLEEIIKMGRITVVGAKDGKRKFSQKEIEQLRLVAMESDTETFNEDKNKKIIGRLKNLYRDHIDPDHPKTGK